MKEKPTYKPLSELAGDRESCEKIFNFVFPGSTFGISVRAPNKKCTNIISEYTGRSNRFIISIWNDGVIFIHKDQEVVAFSKYFALVELIQSLGYSA